MRIYIVGGPEGARLIRAQTRQQAVWFATQGKYQVRPAGQDDLIDLISKGVKVESVSDNSQQKLDLSLE